MYRSSTKELPEDKPVCRRVGWGNLKDKLPTEKVILIGFWTRVRFPSSPPKEKRLLREPFSFGRDDGRENPRREQSERTRASLLFANLLGFALGEYPYDLPSSPPNKTSSEQGEVLFYPLRKQWYIIRFLRVYLAKSEYIISPLASISPRFSVYSSAT